MKTIIVIHHVEGSVTTMPTHANTLGQLIADLMAKYDHTNRSLASEAGVSESAIRNLLKVGIERQTKDPDARTLSLVARALHVDALRLFRLAGYVSPEPAAHSVRGDYLATIFDELPLEKQDAVLSILEALADKKEHRESIQQMRADPKNALAGLYESNPGYLRTVANMLIVDQGITQPVEANNIKPDAKIPPAGATWSSLPVDTQERIRALIRHKLSLDYDPTMVDPEWRD